MTDKPTFRDIFFKLLPHVAVWGLIFLFPYMIIVQAGGVEVMPFAAYCKWVGVAGMTFVVVYYVNYCWLVPRLLLKNRTGLFLIANVVLMFVCRFVFNLWMHKLWIEFDIIDIAPPPDPYDFRLWNPMRFIGDLLPYVPTAFVAAFVRMNARWRMLETLQKESAKQLAEAEVQNMRNQLSPHFLLNTLNNIYALIAFDTDKAQNTVQELSKLLRHVLYDNQQPTTTLSKEVDFIRSYIELMRIRLSGNVRLTTEFSVKKDSQTEISPLIFISLIENAFKHGISPTEPSFISITLSEEDDTIKCVIVNSNFPKSAKDKSGSGIGLQQVQRRLDLGYPDKYEWEKGTSADGKEYYSRITLHTD